MKPEEIVKRLESLKMERSNIDELYELIEQFCRPFSGQYYSQHQGENSVDWRSRQLFDSTAVIACQELAASIHGSLTPPLIKWMNLVFEDDDLNNNQEAAEWLEECSEVLYQALQESDFHLEMNKAYLDLPSWGMSFLIEEEKTQGEGDLEFTTAPLKSSYFESDINGQPKRYYRQLSWSASQVYDKFGEDTPADILEKYINGDVNERFDIIFAIYERDEYKDADVSRPLAPELRPWGYQYVYSKGKQTIGKEGGYYERPVFAPRWLEHSDSKYGLSPAMRAMPDILTLNELVKMILTAAEKAIDPPLWAEEAGLFSDIDFKAGGLTMVRDKDSFGVVQSGASFDVSQLQKQELVQSIRQAFHADDLQLKESPAMTATETMARMELMQRTLGATFGYLKSYMLDPLIQRTFNILFRAGRLPEPPAAVIESNAEMDIQYLGTMARAQKRDEIDAIQGFLADVAAIAQVFPEALDVPDVDKFIRKAAEARNLPKELMKGIEEVEEMRGERDQMMRNREQLEQDEIASKTMSNVTQMMPGAQ